MASHKTVNLRPAWQVANMLRVSRAAISEATKKKYTCAGLPVADWAIKSEGGTVIGYDVPDDIVRALDARENPSLLAEPERKRYEDVIRLAQQHLDTMQTLIIGIPENEPISKEVVGVVRKRLLSLIEAPLKATAEVLDPAGGKSA